MNAPKVYQIVNTWIWESIPTTYDNGGFLFRPSANIEFATSDNPNLDEILPISSWKINKFKKPISFWVRWTAWTSISVAPFDGITPQDGWPSFPMTTNITEPWIDTQWATEKAIVTFVNNKVLWLDIVTRLDITWSIPANTTLDLTTSWVNYTKSYDNWNIDTSNTNFKNNHRISVEVSWVMALKWTQALRVSATQLQLTVPLSNSDWVIVKS